MEYENIFCVKCDQIGGGMEMTKQNAKDRNKIHQIIGLNWRWEQANELDKATVDKGEKLKIH